MTALATVMAVMFTAIPSASALARPPVVQRDANDREAIAISANGVYVLTASQFSATAGKRINVLTKATDTWTFSALNPKLTADGSAMVFESLDRLVPADKDDFMDVYRYVFATKALRRIELTGRPSCWEMSLQSINATGSVLGFLGTSGCFSKQAVWIFDDPTNIWRKPDSRLPSAASRASSEIALDATGRFAVFVSGAIPGCTNCMRAFIYSWATAAVSIVSVKANGTALTDGNVEAISMSPDARVVSFRSNSTGIVPSATSAAWRVFIRDRVAKTNTLVSQRESRGLAPRTTYTGPQLLANGAMITMLEQRPTTIGGSTVLMPQPVLYSRAAKATVVLTATSAGGNPNDISYNAFGAAAAKRVLFGSAARNVTTVAAGAAGTSRVFVSTPA